MASKTPLWLDCDTGHDDAVAMLLAAWHPSLELLGISTLYGNAPLERTSYNTRAILKAIRREAVPVYAGAHQPFYRAPAFAPDIHGASGLDGTTCLPEPSVGLQADGPAVEAMYRALKAQPAGTAWLVATGALTNVALLLAVHPDLAEHLAGLTIMGGAIGGGFTNAPMGVVAGEGERFGNHTPWAEFNIYIDPESAATVFANPVLAKKTTLIPLDLTHQFLATPDIQTSLLYGPGGGGAAHELGSAESLAGTSLVRRLFFEILSFFAHTYATVFGLTAGPPVHDPLAVLAAFLPALFRDHDGERYKVDVVCEGYHGASDHALSSNSQCGRTVAQLLSPGEQGVRIPRSLDTSKAWNIIAECLSLAEDADKKAS